MADFKKNMLRRLRSARQWLTRAEEAFDKDRDIRAELDLMLAEAELQHAREAHKSRHWKYKYSLVGHSAALTLAMVIAVAGLGGAYWWLNGRQTSSPVPMAVQEGVRQPVQQADSQNEPSGKPSAPAAPAVQSVATVAAVPHTEPKAPAAVAPAKDQTGSQAIESRIRDHGESQPAEKEVTLTPDEMQKLVRAAGKSLRGH